MQGDAAPLAGAKRCLAIEQVGAGALAGHHHLRANQRLELRQRELRLRARVSPGRGRVRLALGGIVGFGAPENTFQTAMRGAAALWCVLPVGRLVFKCALHYNKTERTSSSRCRVLVLLVATVRGAAHVAAVGFWKRALQRSSLVTGSQSSLIRVRLD